MVIVYYQYLCSATTKHILVFVDVLLVDNLHTACFTFATVTTLSVHLVDIIPTLPIKMILHTIFINDL